MTNKQYEQEQERIKKGYEDEADLKIAELYTTLIYNAKSIKQHITEYKEYTLEEDLNTLNAVYDAITEFLPYELTKNL